MSFAMPIFDTHHYVKKLEASGLDPKQAEAQVEFQAEILSTIIDNTIVTKDNLKDTSNELKAEIAIVKTQIATVTMELKTEIAEVRTELKAEIAAVRTELKAEIAEIKRDVHLMKWMMAFIAPSLLTIMLKLFLH